MIQRFKWGEDSQTMRIIGVDGIESVVSIRDEDEWAEIEFNVVPMFDKNECIKNQLYFNPKLLSHHDVLSRLIRKYQ